MSRLSVANPRSNQPVSRTARPLSRPLRVDIPLDPLAPIAPWGVDPSPRSGILGASDDPHVPLSDLVDTASAQLLTLRRTLDDAAAADRIVRNHVADLTQRLQQGQRFGVEFDQRLQSASKAAGVLEKAAVTLRGLEELVEQIRSSHAAMEQRFSRKLAEHETQVQSRLNEITAKYDGILTRIDAAAEQAQLRAAEKIDDMQRELRSDADQITANIDRHAAQSQARVSLILDSASDRLSTMEMQAQNLGGRTAKEVDALCDKAARLLGHDPRNPASNAADPVAGSLADAMRKGEELVEHVDESAVRIDAARTAADHTIDALAQARLAAEAVVSENLVKQDALRQTIDAALAQARQMDATLQQALVSQAEATEKSEHASTLLLRQREDLHAIAEAGRYHVEQARTAEQSLRAEIESATVRTAALNRAVNDVNDQAANLVGLAKDVAGLLARAEAAKQAQQAGESAAV